LCHHEPHTNSFLGFGLEIPFFKDTLMPAFMSTFGLTNPASGPIEGLLVSSLLTRFGAFWALPVAMSQLGGLIGTNESVEAKQQRQWLALVSWSAWLVGFAKMCLIEEFEGGLFGCGFNFCWMAIFVVMVAYNFKFVGMSTVLQKLKGE
jgi:hypothetical protein